MAIPAPDPDETAYVLPPQALLLGQALAPLAQGIRQALTRTVEPSGHQFELLDDLCHHTDVIHRALSRLSDLPDRLMKDVLHKEDASPLDVGRVAGRLEQVLLDLIDGYREAQSSHADPDSREARQLILGVYRHHITALCEWLEEMVAVVADPASAVQKRGPPAGSEVELTVTLEMSSPPEMAQLNALAKRLLSEAEASHDPVEPAPSAEPCETEARKPGLLATLGALLFGIGITQATLGRRDE